MTKTTDEDGCHGSIRRLEREGWIL